MNDPSVDAIPAEKTRPTLKADLVALSTWTAAIVAFFWDAVTLRKALFYFDITEINYPYRRFFAAELAAGRFSRWCPGLYCGHPLYSESQAGYLHPLKYLLYPWIETWRAFNLDTIASIWLTGVGSYFWHRRRVGPAGALAGAAILALSGFTWAHWFHTSMINALASVPIILWSLETAWEKGSTRAIVPGALALACEVFAGHLQDALLSVGLVALYSSYRALVEPTVPRKLTALGLAGGLVSLGVLVSAVQWIPSKELIDRSPRAKGLSWEDLTYGSWSPELIPTLVVREAYGTRARDTDWLDGYYPYHEMDAYVGLVALGLAALGAARRENQSRDPETLFWLLLAIAVPFLMLGKFTFLFDYVNKIPLIGGAREPVRFHLLFAVAIAALAARGVERAANSGGVRLRPALFLAGGLVLVSIPILIYDYAPVWTEPRRWIKPYHINRYNWLAEELIVGCVRTIVLASIAYFAARACGKSLDVRRRRRIAAIFPLIVLLDLLGSHRSDVPTVDPRYWTEPPVSARTLQNEPGEVRVFGLARYSAGEPGYASEPFDFMSVRDPLGWSLPIVWGLKSSIGETPIRSERMLAYTDLAPPGRGRFDVESVTHVLLGISTARGLGSPVPAGSAYLYKNKRVLPRARLLGRPVYAEDESEAKRIVAASGKGADADFLRDRIVVEDPDRPLASNAVARGSARIVVDLPERVEVEAEVETPSYLFLADTFDPGWSATVDGNTAAIRPAYIAFRAVYLAKGKHHIVFRYEPAGFYPGLILSGVGGFCSLILLIVRFRVTRLGGVSDASDGSKRIWMDRVPVYLPAVLLAILAISAIGIDARGRPRVHSRWDGGFHRFTWGSGIDAIRPSSPRE